MVLPFICWGSWGVPGHPHPNPHFVFAEIGNTQTFSFSTNSVQFQENRLSVAGRYESQLSLPIHHAEGAPENPSDVGRSVPDTSAFTILTLVLVAICSIQANFMPHFSPNRGNLFARQLVLFVPTPPPRGI
jgi:hypothetical protein